MNVTNRSKNKMKEEGKKEKNKYNVGKKIKNKLSIESDNEKL